LAFQNEEKEKRAAELVIANEELAFQNEEKGMLATELNNLAFYDTLTGLPNRRLLLDRLRRAFATSPRSGRDGALMFIDLDKFKDLNDTLGHDFGDLLLQQTAQRLESCVRPTDTVARLGGDEFVVVLEDLSQHPIKAALQAKAVGDKILATLNQPYLLATHEYYSTLSIGATLFNDHAQSAEELLKRADMAMYQAKMAGRNTLRFFDPKMQDVINARTALEGDLRKALENKEFQLYYQMQVDSSHRPFGAEALIRWIHPDRGLVSPAQFIPLAEESGLILPIGQWVLETACTRLKVWEQDALTRDLILAVNISVVQFHQVDFVAQVQSLVQSHAINPTRLKLEITESLLLKNIENAIATMSALKEIGVRFSLDDFGTGYSSLQYLKRLPIDQIKIDQSFIRDIATDSSDKAIVCAIIAMAHSLNLDVIAEGVETEDQRQFLLEQSCTHCQGYLFGKPVPIEQFEALLRLG
ncbi:MAG: EAL domain-containing protein, partial [Burkholderiaceae bacterium]